MTDQTLTRPGATLAYEVDGSVTLRFPSLGLRCEIEVPVPTVPA